MNRDAILDVSGLTVTFGGVTAVRSLSFQLGRGTIGALIGPNGAGKSTVVNALTGFVRSTSGAIRLDGKDLGGHSAHQVAAAGMGRTFQNIRLFGSMTVRETLLTGAHARLKAGFLSLLFRSRAARQEEQRAMAEAEQLLARVGLPHDVLERTAGGLSYGQQRRVEIARALMGKPRLLLLDEPVAGMNLSEKQEIGELVLRLKATGMSILIVEHDMAVIRRLADHVTVLHHGERLASGSPDAVLSDERVRLAYLGRSA